MLKRIQKISGVGRFKNYSAPTGLPGLSSTTVFFGRNGHGKSTLTAILRSLALGGSSGENLLKGRKTLGENDQPQNIVIEWQSGKKSIFQEGKWKMGIPAGNSIWIFDSEYIRETLFTDTLTLDHRKEICRVVLGKQGLEIESQLRLAIEDERTSSKSVKLLEEQLLRKQQATGTEKYIEIPDTFDKSQIVERRQRIEQEILSKKQEENIRKKARPKKIESSFTIPEDWNKKLLETHSSAHLSAKEIVLKHFSGHFVETASAEQFARVGIASAAASCPFCAQPLIQAESLMQAYAQYFDETYKKKLDAIQEVAQKIEASNLATQITEIENVHAQTLNTIMDWNTHLGQPIVIQALPDTWGVLKRSATQAWTELTKAVQKKSEALDFKFPKDAIPKVEKYLDEISAWISTYNARIEEASLTIDAFLKSLEASSLSDLDSRLGKAKAYEHRYSQEEGEWCQKFHEAKFAHEVKLDIVKKLEEDLQKHSKDIFEKHHALMNVILQDVGVSFRVSKLEAAELKRNIKDVFAHIAIEIEGESVLAATTDEKKPNFKNTLSEGDRSCLALAFFLTCLVLDEDSDPKIVIYDDPITSMDLDRRNKMLHQILRRTGKSAQSIIMTHNTEFTRLMAASEELKGSTFLRIHANQAAGASISDLNTDDLLNEEHRKRVLRVQELISMNSVEDPSDSFKDVRKILEYAIDVKFGHLLGGATNLGKQIPALRNLALVSDDVLAQLGRIHEETSPSLHSGTDYQLLRDASPGEAISVIKDAINLLPRV